MMWPSSFHCFTSRCTNGESMYQPQQKIAALMECARNVARIVWLRFCAVASSAPNRLKSSMVMATSGASAAASAMRGLMADANRPAPSSWVSSRRFMAARVARFRCSEPHADSQLKGTAIAVVALRQQPVAVDAVGLLVVEQVLAFQRDGEHLVDAIGRVRRDPGDRVGFL